MEVKQKIIPFPFWRHINYANYMRMNKRLPIPTTERKKDENTSSINVISIINNRKR